MLQQNIYLNFIMFDGMMMEKEKLKRHLIETTKQLIVFTRTICFNDLVENYKYLITPNLRIVEKDDKHLNEKEISVLSVWNKYENKLLTEEQVVDLLYHDNKVPLWINTTVSESKPDMTIIDLCCSRRLREEKELMHQGLHPFHIQITIPPDSLKIEKEGKFDVNWKKNS